MPYHHLTPAEREVIDSMVRVGYSQQAIAQALHRSPSTLSRELHRNEDTVGRRYCPHWANLLYWKRRKQIVNAHKTGNPQLMAYVRAKLELRWSPEQIAGRLRYAEHPDEPAQWISYQTIYRYVRQDHSAGGRLYRYLRRGRKKYGKRGTGPHPNSWIKGRVSIEQRPAIVAEQARIGDWEGDTFYGAKRQSCLATLVERKTLYLAACSMCDATAASLNDAIRKQLSPLPKDRVCTLTVDNGKEFARFKQLEQELGMAVYFTHPYTAWERPINENTNGLLRQFLPRKTDLRNLSPEQLDYIVQLLNNRPRKKLKYRTPNEAFNKTSVALAM
jgi:transposase, IS30 family